jgi:hypothetical protein
MLARRKTARYVLIAAVVMFALILGFFLWAAASEASDIGSPITTPLAASIPQMSTLPADNPSPTP